MTKNKRASRNQTLDLGDKEKTLFSKKLVRLKGPQKVESLLNKTIHADIFQALPHLPLKFVDLLFIDPPYNINKRFRSGHFKKMENADYGAWIDSWLDPLAGTLKDTASVYICCDWRSSAAVQLAASKYFKILNRITWEREKGRGAKSNWKNAVEDIWFCTMSDKYTFNLDTVKQMRRVIAPYKDENGKPKDWVKSKKGDFRLTHPSNLWTDITVPFWSMPENTDHPTQKPEKLLAKIILASSNAGDVVLDPFSGSGTTSVVAKKLGRNYVGIEIDEMYCCLGEKRLALAENDKRIQGYADGVFWARNSAGVYGKIGK